MHSFSVAEALRAVDLSVYIRVIISNFNCYKYRSTHLLDTATPYHTVTYILSLYCAVSHSHYRLCYLAAVLSSRVETIHVSTFSCCLLLSFVVSCCLMLSFVVFCCLLLSFRFKFACSAIGAELASIDSLTLITGGYSGVGKKVGKSCLVFPACFSYSLSLSLLTFSQSL